MSYYYDIICQQVVKKLQNISTRPYSDKDTNYINYSCAVMSREKNEKVYYDVVESGEVICDINQIKQRTELVTIQIDTHKLGKSYYLLEYADRLTFQLCNATLNDY